ncbi:MAG: polysaccharide biosynthesis C-terminal domain-containing protein [Pseudomonadota bacterium]
MALSPTFLETLGERLLPASLAGRAAPYLALGDRLLTGEGDRAASLRMAGFAFSIRVASAAIGFFSQIVLARVLGAFEYGIFSLVFVASLLGGGLACLGMQTAALKFVATYRASGDLEGLRGILFASRLMALVFASAAALLGGVVIWFAQDLVESFYLTPFVLALALLPLIALSEVQDMLGRAFDSPDAAFLPTFIVRPALLLGLMILAVTSGFGATAITALVCGLLAVFLGVVWQAMQLAGPISRAAPKGARRIELRNWMAVALPIFLVGGFFNLLTNVDVLILGYFVAPDQVAIYFAAAKILALVHFVPFAIKAAVQHRFAALHQSGDQAGLAAFARDAVRWGFGPTAVLALFIGLCAPLILRLFGPGFDEAAPLVWVLIAGLVCRSAVGPAESLLTMVGQERICAIAYAFTLAVNVTLNILLIPRFGLWGAAVATATAMVVEAIVLWVVARRRLGFSVFVI